MRRMFFFLLITTVAQLGVAQVKLLTDKKDVRPFCDVFMQKVTENRLSEAFQIIKPYTKIDAQAIDKLNGAMTEQLASLDAYGKMRSYIFVEEKDVQGSLLNMTYMLKFEYSCLKFDFRFYNNGEGWQVNFLNFTEKIEGFLN